MDDVELLAQQLGRPPLPTLRVVARCVSGRPVVVQQPPVDPAGRPFPTTFWLACPGLVRAVGGLEDAGGVSALEERIARDDAVAADVAAARRRQVALRPALGDLGIGGTRAPTRVKCLHAHAAFAIADGGYRAGTAIVEEAGGIPDPCCMEAGR